MAYVRESSVEDYLVKRVEALGGKAYKTVTPGRKGFPDRLCVLPGGVLFFAELKAPKGVVAPAQLRRIDELKALGQRVFVAPSKADVDHVLKVMVPT